MMKLTDTQTQILSAAAQHPERLLIPPGRLPAGARQKVAQALLKQDLGIAVHRPTYDAVALWPVDGDAALLKITDEGLRAIGVEPQGGQIEADEAEPGGLEAAKFEVEQKLAQSALDAGGDLTHLHALKQAQAAGEVETAVEAELPAGARVESAKGGQLSSERSPRRVGRSAGAAWSRLAS